MKVVGEVFSGEGEAEEFLQLEPYKDFIARHLDLPFPGTLNLKVDSSQAKKLKQKSKFHRLEEFRYKGEDYGGINLFLVNLEGNIVGLLDPDRTRYGEDVIELVSEKELRKEHGLEDGDTVEIEPFRP